MPHPSPHCHPVAVFVCGIFGLLFAFGSPLTAQEPAQTDMQKWIAATDAQWQAVFKRDVSGVHETEVNALKLKFLSALDAALLKASGAGDLDVALALRNEQKRFAETNFFPEQDATADAAVVKQLRAAIRPQLARAEKENAARTRAIFTK